MAQQGGSWKVAYADFATAMMALFLVLWITSQDEKVKEAVAEHFRDPSGAGDGSGSAEFPPPGGTTFVGLETPAGGPSAAEGAARRGRSGRRMVVERKRGPVCRGVIVPFAENSAELDVGGRAELDALLPTILGKPHRLEIRGHSSGRRLPAASNYADLWELSYARCISAMNYLIERGIDPRRIRLSQSGEFEPQNRQRGSSAQAQNSRVEVTILTEWLDGFGEIRNELGEPLEQPEFRLPEEALPSPADSPE